MCINSNLRNESTVLCAYNIVIRDTWWWHNTNYDPRAGVAERTIYKQRAFSLGTCHDDSLVLQLQLLFAERAACWLKGIHLDVKSVPNLCTKEQPSSWVCCVCFVCLCCDILTSYSHLILFESIYKAFPEHSCLPFSTNAETWVIFS